MQDGRSAAPGAVIWSCRRGVLVRPG